MTQVREAPVASTPTTYGEPPLMTEGAGWAWFAAVLIGVGGLFNLIDGLIGLTNAQYFNTIATTHGVHLVITNELRTWSWFAIGAGAVMLIAAAGLPGGYLWARILAVTVLVIDMIFQLAFLPLYPFWGLTILAVNVIAIYGTVVHVHRRV